MCTHEVQCLGSPPRGTCLAALCAFLAGMPFLLAACGGGGGGNSVAVPASYAVGGSVSGLLNAGLALQINGGETLSISADGSFRFPTPLVDRSRYDVRVSTQPGGHPAQACTVVNGFGFISGGNVATISVSCTTKTFSVSGTVFGRTAGRPVVLSNNGSDTVQVSGNGTFTFPIALTDETGYSVTLVPQPFERPEQVCAVSSGSGTLHGANVSDVSVVCVTLNFSVSATVSGLRGSGLVLQNNNGDDLNTPANGPFTFATPLPDGSSFNVTVRTQPTNQKQTCIVVANGSGEVFRDQPNVTVECTWTKQLGTPVADEVNGAATGSDGSLHLVGRTAGGFDGHVNAGGWDALLVKFDANGEQLWSRQIGTSADENGNAVAVDAQNNVFVAGSTLGGLDGNASAGAEDIFVVKYDSDGNRQWTRQLGTGATDIAYGVTADSNGNVYLAGRTDGDLNGAGSAGGTDLFVVKFDAAGNLLWTRQFGTAGSDIAYAIAKDASGNVYLAGGTTGNLDGITNPEGEMGFVLKYDSQGNRQWTRPLCQILCSPPSASQVLENRAIGIAVDSQNNVRAVGWAAPSSSGVLGERSTLSILYHPSGIFLDLLLSREFGNDVVPTSIAMGSNDSFYIGGWMKGVTTGGGKDPFIRKFASTAAESWANVTFASGDTEAFAVAADATNNYVYLAGRTFGSLERYVNLGSEDDFFVVKYDGSGVRQ
jgi:hypothetical protein